MKRFGTVLAIIGMLLIYAPTAAEAGTGKCVTGMEQDYPADHMKAFAGHWLRVSGHVCYLKYGPGRIQATRRPVVTFPDRAPLVGIIEKVEVSTKPYVVANSNTGVIYEFVVKLTPLRFAGSEHFTFRVYYMDDGHKVCFVGGRKNHPKCSTYWGWPS